MYLISSFRLERGSHAIVFDGATVTMEAGWYAHVSMANVESSCTAFAAALQAALIAAGKTLATVSYSTTTHAYTLSNGGGSFAVAFSVGSAGTRMARTLGFTTGATASSHTSTVRPYYVIVPQHDGRSNYPGLRRVARSVRRETEDGRGFALGPTTVPKRGMWEHWHEPAAATYRDRASSSTPWTWEDLWDHAGRLQELVLVSPPSADPEPDGIWQLRTPDFDESVVEPQYPNQHVVFKVRFDGVRLGNA